MKSQCSLSDMETEQSQYQYSSGSVVQPLNRRKYRRSHPPEPKLTRIPNETKENRNAFTKHTPAIAKGIEKAPKKADSRKGSRAAFSRPTIDAEQEMVLCIKGNVSGEKKKYGKAPNNKPLIQHVARTSGIPLRAFRRAENQFLCIPKPPPNTDRLPKTCLRKKGAGMSQGIEYFVKPLRTYYTPFLTKIQAFLAKIAFFVNYDG